VGIPAECMVFLLMGGAYLRSRIKQAGKWDQETIVSFFLCQYCSGEYLHILNSSITMKMDIHHGITKPYRQHFLKLLA
ncbi:hypothetical protein, partial [Aeromonas sp. PrichA-15]|uniref:hypothetical protein n=1 Tax=Aeromonas sp. PrichA-15 TaxID=2823360 RepID=UPI001B33BC17